MKDRTSIHRQFQAVDAAYRAGDMAALRTALNDPDGFPNCPLPHGLGVSDYPLEYALYWSPLPFIVALIDLGSDVNREDTAGFPSLIAALSTDRPDRLDIVRLLLDRGADVHQRGLNDWTPLHYAVSLRDLPAVDLLLACGADPHAPTRIDECTTALEDAERAGFIEAAARMHAIGGNC